MAETLVALDGALLLWIQENIRHDILTPLILAVTKTGNAGLIWILCSIFLLGRKQTRKAGLAGLLALLFSLLLNNLLLKNAVMRIRPYEVVEGLVLLTERAHDFSFPSGHTGSSFACATAVCLMLRQCRRKNRFILYGVLLGYAALMGFTRLYIGIHYPTDVLVGMVTGIFCGFFAYGVIQYASQLQKKEKEYK